MATLEYTFHVDLFWIVQQTLTLSLITVVHFRLFYFFYSIPDLFNYILGYNNGTTFGCIQLYIIKTQKMLPVHKLYLNLHRNVLESFGTSKLVVQNLHWNWSKTAEEKALVLGGPREREEWEQLSTDEYTHYSSFERWTSQLV